MTINSLDHCWLGATPMNELFPFVYEACSTSSFKVVNMGCWVDLLWYWDFGVDEFSLHSDLNFEGC